MDQTVAETPARQGHKWIIWATLTVALTLWIVINSIQYQQLRNDVLRYGQQQLAETLRVHSAIHRFVEEEQKPIVYSLQNNGNIDQEWFSPGLLSGTYIARRIQEEINVERRNHAIPEISFRLAAINARNPVNEANEYEAAAIRDINQGRIEHVLQIRDDAAGQRFYAAIPIFRNQASCARCHGDPDDAPADLIKRYGDSLGFWRPDNEISGIISVEVPLKDHLLKAKSNAASFALKSALGIGVFAGILVLLLNHIRIQALRLDEMSRTDKLTELPNRRHFAEQIETHCAMSERYGQPLSMILIDLDHFKQINDTHGHLIGDKVLKAFAQTLRRYSRRTDVVARWGGEEFVCLLPETSLGNAINHAEKLRKHASALVLPENIRLTASCGVIAREPGEPPGAMLNRVDELMYAAKAGGRDRVCGTQLATKLA